jgi:hypothetical protein
MPPAASILAVTMAAEHAEKARACAELCGCGSEAIHAPAWVGVVMFGLLGASMLGLLWLVLDMSIGEWWRDRHRDGRWR